MYQRRLKRRLTAVLVLIGTVTVAPVFADVVIYSDFGAGDSHNNGVTWVIGTYLNEPNEVVGEPFTTTTSIQFADAQLALLSPNQTFNGTTADVYLESDSGGNPGSILDTLVEQSPISNGIVTFDCSLCPTLSAATTYWIVAAEGNGHTFWFFNNTGAIVAALSASDTGPWSDNTAYASGAFEVDGSVSQVPEPSSLALLCTVAAGMGFAARCKRAAVVAPAGLTSESKSCSHPHSFVKKNSAREALIVRSDRACRG